MTPVTKLYTLAKYLRKKKSNRRVQSIIQMGTSIYAMSNWQKFYLLPTPLLSKQKKSLGHVMHIS